MARELNLYASVYNQGRLRTEELYRSNSPVWFSAIDKDNIEGGGKYYFSVDWKKNSIKIANQVIPFDSTLRIGNSTYRVIPNPEYNQNLTGKNYYVVFNSVAGAAELPRAS